MNYEYYRITNENLKTMKLLRGHVLIRVYEAKKDVNGIVLAFGDNKPFLPTCGIIVLISDKDNPDKLKKGDGVMFEKYEGYRFRDENDNDYILMETKKINGLLWQQDSYPDNFMDYFNNNN